MNYDALLTLYFERSTALQNYWTLYVVVIGGLLAVVSMRKEPDVIAGVLVSVLFLCFAYKNLDAIHDATLNRFAALDAIRNFDLSSIPANQVRQINQVRHAMEPTLTPPEYGGVRNFHVFCDLFTVIIIWALQWRRWRRKANLTDRATSATS